jgi:hypothetical protein
MHLQNESSALCDEPARHQTRSRVDFGIRLAAEAMYVVVSSDDGVMQICTEMAPGGIDLWFLPLGLPAGRYRYRYYALHRHVPTYVSPRDVDPNACMQGLDAQLVISPADQLGVH